MAVLSKQRRWTSLLRVLCIGIILLLAIGMQCRRKTSNRIANRKIYKIPGRYIVAVSPSMRIALTTSQQDHSLVSWAIPSCTRIHSFSAGARIKHVGFLDNGTDLVVISQSDELQVVSWTAAPNRIIRSKQFFLGQIDAVAHIPQTNKIVLSSKHSLWIYDFHTDRIVCSRIIKSTEDLHLCLVSLPAPAIAHSSNDTITLLSAVNLKVVGKLTYHRSPVVYLGSPSNDMSSLVSVDDDGMCAIWDLESQNRVGTIDLKTGSENKQLNGFALSSNGEYIAVATGSTSGPFSVFSGGAVYVYSFDGQLQWHLDWFWGGVIAVKFLESASVELDVVCGCFDGSLSVWKLK